MKPVDFVCLNVGDAYPDDYVRRLYGMLKRFAGCPFTLHCVTDRQRTLPQSVHQVDSKPWVTERPGMRKTTNKLKLFDESAVPWKEFIYLDITLLVKRDMTPLLEFAESSPAGLIILRDWNYECYNSSVMRVRQGEGFEAIYKAFAAGKEYPQHVKGDQDFIYAAIRDHGLEQKVDFWPDPLVASYKKLRDAHGQDPAQAKRMLEEAVIVKFHGKPRPHELTDRAKTFARVFRNPSRWGSGYFSYLSSDIRRWWREADQAASEG